MYGGCCNARREGGRLDPAINPMLPAPAMCAQACIGLSSDVPLCGGRHPSAASGAIGVHTCQFLGRFKMEHGHALLRAAVFRVGYQARAR